MIRYILLHSTISGSPRDAPGTTGCGESNEIKRPHALALWLPDKRVNAETPADGHNPMDTGEVSNKVNRRYRQTTARTQ